jgi:hypothetical protein
MMKFEANKNMEIIGSRYAPENERKAIRNIVERDGLVVGHQKCFPPSP